jgi:hypothetical protein
MTTYLVHFTAIEWDTGHPGEYPAAESLPTEYTLCVEADSRLEAREIAGDRMSDDTCFLFYAANTTVTEVRP